MALVRTDIPEECIVSIIRVKNISKLGAASAVTSNTGQAGCSTDFRLKEQ
jgi:hypothetical protein